MPEISRFYGIVIYMFFNDHNPPHFHISYGEYKAIINLNDEVVNGFIPKRALKLVFEWMEIHKNELIDNWDLAQCNKNLKPIEPLN